MPELFRLWLDQRWQAGVVPTQLILLSGLPLVLFYSIDAALLAGNQSSVFRKIAIIQGVTLAATVLCVSPFGLDLACLSLALRPWVLLPIFLAMFGRACHMQGNSALLPPLRSLIGAIIMAALLNLPFLRPTWLHQSVDFAFLATAGAAFYISYLYCFARRELRELLSGIFFQRF